MSEFRLRMTVPRERTGLDMYLVSLCSKRSSRPAMAAYPKRGMTVCANNLVIRMEQIDDAVLTTIGGEVLSPKIIKTAIAGVNDAMKPANIDRETARRQREIATLDQDIGRLTEAIEADATSLRNRNRVG